MNDSNYTKSPSQKLDPNKTVFVGGLHGQLNAEGLAKIMNDLFEGVIYAGTSSFYYIEHWTSYKNFSLINML